MKEIKFRAWDKKNNEIISLWNIYINGEENVGSALQEALDSDRYILMQYTGLKDKNGVEIYEGDIVRDGGTTWVQPMILVVSSEPGTFMVRDNEGNHCTLASFDTSELGIIGNIYENKELLEDKE